MRSVQMWNVNSFPESEGIVTPEGPELLRSRDFLHQILVNRRIVELKVLGGRYRSSKPEGLDHFQHELLLDPDAGLIKSINVKGKFMYWELNNQWSLWCTYGMSGQWEREQTKHSALAIFHRTTRVGVMEDCIPPIYFNDQRHFGTLKFVKGEEELAQKLASLGPDMLREPSAVEFLDRLYKCDRKTIAEALMDQSVVSGIGNYVKAESLYLAEISPHRIVNSLTTGEIVHLRDQIINVMRASYRLGGASIQTYRNPDGSGGEMQRRFVVYGHDTDPLGNEVRREATSDGRTTWWVPNVQK